MKKYWEKVVPSKKVRQLILLNSAEKNVYLISRNLSKTNKENKKLIKNSAP
jgi:hypothetical protein